MSASGIHTQLTIDSQFYHVYCWFNPCIKKYICMLLCSILFSESLTRIRSFTLRVNVIPWHAVQAQRGGGGIVPTDVYYWQ